MITEKIEYFLRLFCPDKLYAYSTKVRVPQNPVDFRKFLVAKYALADGGSAIDGGAHIGYYTRYFAEIVGERGKVYSFEPNPYMFRLLNKYAKCRSNIVACQKALSDETTISAFYAQPYCLSQDSVLGVGREGQKKVSVEAVTLDEFIGPAEDIRLMKLDVEGHELQVILGASELIQRCRPWVIFEYVQNEGRNDRAVVEQLECWNYRCIDLHTLKEVSRTDLTDVLAMPEERESLVEALGLF